MSGFNREIERLEQIIVTLTAERDDLQVENAILHDACGVYKEAVDRFNARLDKLLDVAEKKLLAQKSETDTASAKGIREQIEAGGEPRTD